MKFQTCQMITDKVRRESKCPRAISGNHPRVRQAYLEKILPYARNHVSWLWIGMPNPAYLNRATNSVILRITSQFLSKYLKSSSQPRNGAFRPSFALIRPVTAAVN